MKFNNHPQFRSKESHMTRLIAAFATLVVLTFTLGCNNPTHGLADRTLTVKFEGVDAGTVACDLVGTCEGDTKQNILPQAKKDSQSSSTIPGKVAFTVCKGTFNVTCRTSAGLEMKDYSSINIDMPDADHEITMFVKKVDGNTVTPTVVDFTDNIAAANAVGGDIVRECDPLPAATTGFKSGSVTRAALVDILTKCTQEKNRGDGIHSLLSLKIDQARADNPKLAEAKAALVSLGDKIKVANGAITKAWDALIEGGPVVNPDAGQPDAGQPDAGQPDAGQPDAGQPDAGQPDAGAPCQGVAEGAITMGSNPQFRVDKGGPALDISTTKVLQCRAGNLVQVAATCGHSFLIDVAAVTTPCTTITPGGTAGCERASVSYSPPDGGTAVTPINFKMYNWENGATGVCP